MRPTYYDWFFSHRNGETSIAVFFNVYCWTNKTINDATEMEEILKEYLAPEFSSLIDTSSIAMKGMSLKYNLSTI